MSVAVAPNVSVVGVFLMYIRVLVFLCVCVFSFTPWLWGRFSTPDILIVGFVAMVFLSSLCGSLVVERREPQPHVRQKSPF